MRSVSIAISNAARLHDIAEGREPQRGIRTVNCGSLGIDLKVASMKEAFSPFASEEINSASSTPHSPLTTQGFLLTNPPYGKRLGDQSIAEGIYKEMAGLTSRFPGWKLAVITDHSGFESFFGKKADSCREISNGAIPSYFYQYEAS